MSGWWHRRGDEGGHGKRPFDRLPGDVGDEIDFHIEMRVRDNLARGLSPQEARAEALERFGARAPVEAEMVELGRTGARGAYLRETAAAALAEVRLALRALARRPGFSLLAVATLGLGIGATTAVFSMAYSLLFQPVQGTRAPEELWAVRFGPEGSLGSFPVSHLDYLDVAGALTAVRGLAATHPTGAHVALPGRTARRVEAELVSDDYAEVLGLVPLVGRAVGPEDAADPHVVMVSDRLAREAFGSTDLAVGRQLTVNARTFLVVGVAPRGFRGAMVPGATDLWLPVGAHGVLIPEYGEDALTSRRRQIWLEFIGRLSPGSTSEVAQEQARAVLAGVVERVPESPLRRTSVNFVAPIGMPAFARGGFVDLFAILGAVAGCLTLLACVNAANLLLARAAHRRGELAVRRALGAGRSRLVGQLLAEASLLTGAGAACGVLIAFGAVRVFRGERIHSWMPPMEGLQVDGTVLLFALGLSAVTGLAFGVAPSLLATRDDALGTGAEGRGTHRLGPSNALVVAQVAISLLLVVGAGLLLDTVRALDALELGFRPGGVLEASVDPGTHGYDDGRRIELYRRVLERGRTLPGVESVGLASFPLQGGMRAGYTVRREGVARDDPEAIYASANQISPGFLAAAGFELVEGRDFTDDEFGRQQVQDPVALLSESAARALFPDGSAVGRRIDLGFSTSRVAVVVGVVRDARLARVKEAGGALVLEPFGSLSWMPGFATVYARGRDGSLPPSDGLRAVLAGLDPTLPWYDVQPLRRRVEESVSAERLMARLTGLFAALALLLAAVGLYGVMAMAVQRRTREVGVRLALGADAATMRALVVGQGLRITALGVVIGLVVATRASGVLAGRLWGVRPNEPSVLVAAVCTLVLAAVLATWFPARRATRVDPVVALRAE